MRKRYVRKRKIAIISSKGWQKLQMAQSKTSIWNPDNQCCTLEDLSEKTGLSTHTLSKVHTRKKGVDLRTLVRYFSAFNLTLEPEDYVNPMDNGATTQPVSALPLTEISVTEVRGKNNRVSWGLAPDVSGFVGRTAELATLEQWILEDGCHLITLLGVAGMGKTWLATRLTEKIQHRFERVVWHSIGQINLSEHPIPIDNILDDLISDLSPTPISTFPESIPKKVGRLTAILREIPCLLILDNINAIMANTPQTSSRRDFFGQNTPNNQVYEELLRQLGKGRHQSCVILTSRVTPKLIKSEENLWIRSFYLPGLRDYEIKEFVNAQGLFPITVQQACLLRDYYGGNPLILAMVDNTIQGLFQGRITDFLKQEIRIIPDIAELLGQQLESLSKPEKEVMQVLATQNKLLFFADLRSLMSRTISTFVLLESLKSLKELSLIKSTATYFSLQPLFRDYLKENWVVHFENYLQPNFKIFPLDKS